jgi:hypothetical protein
MPFAERAKLRLTNEGTQTCPALYYQIDYRTLDKPPADDLHLHAAYRQAFPCERGKHYVILDTDGDRGHFAGCNLSVEQKDDSWWGEGDVRVYVDGEKTPSIAGTGSEDDFGGAWCYSHEFSYAQFGARLRARFNRAGILEHCTPDLKGKDLNPWRWPEAWKPRDLWNVYRYHVSDPVPFRQSILVNIEHGWINNERTDWYSSVAYWYQAGKPTTRTPLPAVKDRIPGYLRPHDHGDGRWEAENMADNAVATAGEIIEAGMEFWGELFSHQYALQWDAAKTGDTLRLPFTVARPGQYRISLRPCRVEHGGTFALAVDNAPPAEPINLYQPPPFPGLFDSAIGEFALSAGDHAIRVICRDPDARSKGRRFILDRFHVTPVGVATSRAS